MELLGLLILVAVFYHIANSFRQYESKNPYHNKNASYSNAFSDRKTESVENMIQTEFGLIVALAAKLAHADGKYCDLEKELIDHVLDQLASHFDDSARARQSMEALFEQEGKIAGNTAQIADELYFYLIKNYEERVKILDFLINLAHADGTLSASEEAILQQVAHSFQIDSSEYERILAQFTAYYARRAPSGPTIEESYALLGASQDEDFAAIKKKYRQLVRENHPDIIRGKGLGDDYVKEATEKLQEINAAYEAVKKHLGA